MCYDMVSSVKWSTSGTPIKIHKNIGLKGHHMSETYQENEKKKETCQDCYVLIPTHLTCFLLYKCQGRKCDKMKLLLENN